MGSQRGAFGVKNQLWRAGPGYGGRILVGGPLLAPGVARELAAWKCFRGCVPAAACRSWAFQQFVFTPTQSWLLLPGSAAEANQALHIERGADCEAATKGAEANHSVVH